MPRSTLFTPALAGLAALALTTATTQAAPQAPSVGESAPSFQLQDLEGKSHSLSDFKGQLVVLHFQQIGCPWEKNYQSYLNDLSKQYSDGDQKVQFLAINSNKNDSVSELKKTKSERPVAYPILKDPGNEVADKYGAKVTPHIYVIDKEGTLRYRGGLEEVPPSPGKATTMDQQYLKPTLEAVLAGNSVPKKVTTAKGCGIKRAN
jgi:peroxiredoxin